MLLCYYFLGFVQGVTLVTAIDYRLPTDVIPLRYDLCIYPDISSGVFNGTVNIELNVTATCSTIIVNKYDLDIFSLNLTYTSTSSLLTITSATEDTDLQEYIITPSTEIEAGKYTLSIGFSGNFSQDLVGLYQSTYVGENNNTRKLAVAVLPPAYARNVFPCLDEPKFKAQFDIKLVQPSGDNYTSISNMNVKSIAVNEPASGLKTVTFATSPPMPTFLVGLVVCDFQAQTTNVTNLDGETFPVSFYTTEAQLYKSALPLQVATNALAYYINLFNVSYPLPKFDMVAIADITFSLVESWGMVQAAEHAILYTSNTSSTSNMDDVIFTTCYGVAHMWVGTLVSVDWWDDIWITEGIPTWAQYRTANELYPDWGFIELFLFYEVLNVMDDDASVDSDPMIQEITTPDEIANVYDSIRTSKAAAVIRMLENFVGSDIFYTAIATDLKTYAYQSENTSGFYDGLQDLVDSSLNISAIMNTWTLQAGFPVVNVVKNGTVYTLTQKRFLSDPNAVSNSTSSTYGFRWTIPITYVTSENSTSNLVWFQYDASSLSLTVNTSVEWIKFNHDQVGFYRVNYETSEWETLINILKSDPETFTAADRTQLVGDAFSLAAAAQLSYNVTLELASYLVNESHYIPWDMAYTDFQYMDFMLADTDISTSLNDYIISLVKSVYKNVTWSVGDSDSHITLRLRPVVLEMACNAGYDQCLTEAGNLFLDWIYGTDDVRPPPDTRYVVYKYGIQNVNREAEWDQLFQKMLDETDSAERFRLLNGLSGIRNATILTKYLNLAINQSYVKAAEFYYVFGFILTNSIGPATAWDWIRDNVETLMNDYGYSASDIADWIGRIVGRLHTEESIEEIESFFETYPEIEEAFVTDPRQTIYGNINWITSNNATIDAWLKSYMKTDNNTAAENFLLQHQPT
ncbi:glutamyl aminopeptidase isoform X1 [Neodiprion lecontei]|uniref:Aminopeptidase n=2 Tax=Neodiprion lecontei TaxID=441921 RepID=A0ABM3FK36_NEOLC|nr:glutamyl aminopeptidase isoform X1 [Neodiprion lecontei]